MGSTPDNEQHERAKKHPARAKLPTYDRIFYMGRWYVLETTRLKKGAV